MCEKSSNPPAILPPEIVTRLNKLTPEQLQEVARLAGDLAESKERTAHLEERNENKRAEGDEDPPENVPRKATTTIKEINGNRYYYWQWRDGEKVKSEYKGPVDPDT